MLGSQESGEARLLTTDLDTPADVSAARQAPWQHGARTVADEEGCYHQTLTSCMLAAPANALCNTGPSQ